MSEEVVESVCTELVLLVTNGRHLVWLELNLERKNMSDHLRHNGGVTRTFGLVPGRDIEEL